MTRDLMKLADAIDPRKNAFSFIIGDPAVIEPAKYLVEDRDLIAASDALRSLAWRPIEEAPKDGAEILAWYQHQGRTCELVSFSIHGYWQSKGEPLLGFEQQEPLWCHLPAREQPPEPK